MLYLPVIFASNCNEVDYDGIESYKKKKKIHVRWITACFFYLTNQFLMHVCLVVRKVLSLNLVCMLSGYSGFLPHLKKMHACFIEDSSIVYRHKCECEWLFVCLATNPLCTPPLGQKSSGIGDSNEDMHCRRWMDGWSLSLIAPSVHFSTLVCHNDEPLNLILYLQGKKVPTLLPNGENMSSFSTND